MCGVPWRQRSTTLAPTSPPLVLVCCRRVNALENVVKPRLENTISYIKVR